MFEPRLQETVRFVDGFWEEVRNLANVHSPTYGEDVMSHVAQQLATGARRLMRADGACIVFRELQEVHYFKEDAVAPMWTGQRFPIEHCISGWSILHAEPAVIPDIYADPRIPIEHYKETFVKSLVMQPVARTKPFAAIGVYWATKYVPEERELGFLQALADLAALVLTSAQMQRAFS